jgi:hypothetical protein
MNKTNIEKYSLGYVLSLDELIQNETNYYKNGY